MTKKSLTRRLAIAGAVALAMVTAADPPALAGSTTISDPSGVDYDAACLVNHPLAPVGAPNSVGSPGFSPRCLVGTYDGSTESTDIRTVSLTSNGVNSPGPSNTQLVASCDVDGSLPTPGSTTPPMFSGAMDLPSNIFFGSSCKVMFQNRDLQTNVPYFGCPRGLGAMWGLHESWKDGFHFFIGYDVTWDGSSWIHSVKVGTYDPSPTGGFLFRELGVNDGFGWWSNDPNALFGTHWNVAPGPVVTVDGVLQSANVMCTGLVFTTPYAEAGDRIINVKGLTSADMLLVLPVTVPLSLIPGFADITTVGGFIFFSDTTDGNSRNNGLGAVLATATGDLAGTPCNNEGLLGNLPCVAYTHGLAGRPLAGEWLDINPERELPGAFASMPDTLARGPRCWTYTMGGLLPPNPLWVPDQACHVDDDNIGGIHPGERGTFLPEFWDTNYGFTV